MLEATGALLDDEALELVVGAFVDVSTLLVVELLTCEALEAVLEATDVDVSTLADDAVLAGASCFTDVSVLVAAVWLLADVFVDIPTLAAFRACSAVRDG